MEADIEKFKNVNKKAEITADVLSKCESYAQIFIETLNNNVLRLSKKSKQCRFSEETLRVAMMLFLKSRRSYEQLQSSPYVTFPSVRTLQQYAKANKLEHGEHLQHYIKFLQRFKNLDSNCVLLLDKMKNTQDNNEFLFS
ncbi:MAG: hypothetical protein EAZ31_01615, partial [Cytophagia bacterium]